MTYAYVEAPHVYREPGPAVFLAGGITGCPDWQTEAAALLADWPVAVFNPRRANFPIHDPAAAEGQIRWEFEHLKRANVVLFWFPDSGSIVQPIALFELGAHAAAGKTIAVGCDPNYVRRADVVYQLALVRPEVTVRDALADVVGDVRQHAADVAATR